MRVARASANHGVTARSSASTDSSRGIDAPATSTAPSCSTASSTRRASNSAATSSTRNACTSASERSPSSRHPASTTRSIGARGPARGAERAASAILRRRSVPMDRRRLLRRVDGSPDADRLDPVVAPAGRETPAEPCHLVDRIVLWVHASPRLRVERSGSSAHGPSDDAMRGASRLSRATRITVAVGIPRRRDAPATPRVVAPPPAPRRTGAIPSFGPAPRRGRRCPPPFHATPPRHVRPAPVDPSLPVRDRLPARDRHDAGGPGPGLSRAFDPPAGRLLGRRRRRLDGAAARAAARRRPRPAGRRRQPHRRHGPDRRRSRGAPRSPTATR